MQKAESKHKQLSGNNTSSNGRARAACSQKSVLRYIVSACRQFSDRINSLTKIIHTKTTLRESFHTKNHLVCKVVFYVRQRRYTVSPHFFICFKDSASGVFVRGRVQAVRYCLLFIACRQSAVIRRHSSSLAVTRRHAPPFTVTHRVHSLLRAPAQPRPSARIRVRH